MIRALSYFLAALLPLMLSSCQPAAESAGTTLLDERVTFARDAKLDTLQRTLTVHSAGTIVALLEENDLMVTLKVTATDQKGATTRSVEVMSPTTYRGIEVAALEVPAGAHVEVTATSRSYLRGPDTVALRIMQVDTRTRTGKARAAAWQTWTRATLTDKAPREDQRTRATSMDQVIAHFESDDGDARMAAWAHFMKAQLNYSADVSWKEAMLEAQRAQRSFSTLPTPDKRNVARARFLAADASLEAMVQKDANDPVLVKVSQESQQTLLDLSKADSGLSASERVSAVMSLGFRAYQLSDLKTAEVHFKRALDEARQVGDWNLEFGILANLGTVASEHGNYGQAVRYYDPVMARIDLVDAASIRTIHIFNAAYADAYSGRTERALDRFLLGLKWARETKSRTQEAQILHGLGFAYWRLGDLAQARVFITRALELRRAVDDQLGVVSSLRMLGALARESGDSATALSMHQDAGQLSSTEQFKLMMKHEMALDYAGRGDHAHAIELCRAALRPGDGPNYPRRDETKLVLAEQLLMQPTPQARREAGQLADEVLQIAVQRADIPLEVFAHRVRAKLRAQRGEYAQARSEYEAAIRLIYAYGWSSGNPELQAATLSIQQGTFRSYVDLLMRDVAKREPGKLQAASDEEGLALRTLEYARAVNFRPVRDARLDAATQKRVDELLSQMAEKRVRIAALANRGAAPDQALEQLQLDTASLRAEVDRLRLGKAREARDAQLPTAVPGWPARRPGVAQLSYALGHDRAYLWVRDARGLSATVLAETPARIEQRIDALLTLPRSAAAELERSLAALSPVLLPAGAVQVEAAVLEIVADGKLAQLPFAAMRTPADPSRLLIETHVVRMVASMAANDSARTPPPHRLSLVAVAGGSGSTRELGRVFPSLSATRAEAAAIAKLFIGVEGAARVRTLGAADGNATELRRLWADGVDVLHFATHGLANVNQPMASLLLLPAVQPDGGATYLTAGQVQGWRGNSALVFLSACETAVGPVKFADGIPGLQRAFLRAGASGVIATLWPIDDVTARDFSVEFYRRYLESRAADQALRDIQAAWVAAPSGASPAEATLRRMTALAHVYYTQ